MYVNNTNILLLIYIVYAYTFNIGYAKNMKCHKQCKQCDSTCIQSHGDDMSGL